MPDDTGCAKPGCTERETATFTIADGARTVVVELCAKHGKPVRDAMRYGSTEPSRRRREPPHRNTHAVIPVD